MANPADPGEAFIREVDDELSRDRLRGFWSRYGRLLLVAVGLTLVAAAGWLYWREQQARAAAGRAADLTRAVAELREGQTTEAEGRIKALTSAPEPGTRALARLAEAAVLAGKGDMAGAAALLDAMAADATLAQPFRDLALLRSVLLRFDELPPATIVERLRPLARPGNPWFGSAGELSALAHLKAGRPELARPLLEGILKDEAAPVSIRGRVQQLLATLPAGPAGAAAAVLPAATGAGTAAGAAASADAAAAGAAAADAAATGMPGPTAPPAAGPGGQAGPAMLPVPPAPVAPSTPAPRPAPAPLPAPTAPADGGGR